MGLKWYHSKRRPNVAYKNGTILKKAQNSLTKMVPFKKRPKIPQQKRYHLRKGPKFANKNGTILEKAQNSSTKIVPFENFSFSPLKPPKIKPPFVLGNL